MAPTLIPSMMCWKNSAKRGAFQKLLLGMLCRGDALLLARVGGFRCGGGRARGGGRGGRGRRAARRRRRRVAARLRAAPGGIAPRGGLRLHPLPVGPCGEIVLAPPPPPQDPPGVP